MQLFSSVLHCVRWIYIIVKFIAIFTKTHSIYHSEELKRVQKELEEKRLAVTYSGQQLSETQHKLRTMEGKANQLQAHNIQLSVKLEELKSKYEGRIQIYLVQPFACSLF